jgi:hypothetical protein
MAKASEEIKIRRVDFYPVDWLEGTIGLSHEERSVYITVIAAIYAVGGPVELKHVRKFCPGHHFKRGLDGLVAKGKIDLTGAENKVTQKQAEIELKVARQRTEQAREMVPKVAAKSVSKADNQQIKQRLQKVRRAYYHNQRLKVARKRPENGPSAGR